LKNKKSTSRKNHRKKASPLAGAAHSFAGRLLTRFMARVLLIVALVAGGFMTMEWVTQLAQGFPAFTVYPEAMRCTSRPAWLAASERLTSSLLGEIHQVFAAYPPNSIFHDQLEASFKKDPSSFSPWIESIERFERLFTSRYRISVKLRRPVAVFAHENRSYFIDGRGVVITSVDRVENNTFCFALPRVRGFGQTGFVKDGRAALNRRLVEGAAVGRELEALDRLGIGGILRIREIDVSRYGEGKPEDVTLITEDDVRILWGRSARNSRFRGIDPSPQQKAEKLAALLEKVPGLEGVSEVNVTFDKIFYRLDDGS
jgi:cell division septal protein FtsQ